MVSSYWPMGRSQCQEPLLSNIHNRPSRYAALQNKHGSLRAHSRT